MDRFVYYLNENTDPFFNQAFEEYLFLKETEKNILLLWRNEPCVVCGSYQNIFAEVSVDDCNQRGIKIVRRPSGGGTVYHDLGNINYTIITSCDAKNVQYAPLIEPLVKALNSIGIPASLNRLSDIAIDGIKVSGSAQKILKNRVLHHGTLLFDCDLSVLRAVANGQRECFETKGTKSVPWPVTNMREYLPELSTEEFLCKLAEAMKRLYEVEEATISPEEIREIERLKEEKYLSWDWTYGKSPKFVFTKQVTIGGKAAKVRYEAQKGVITDFSLTPFMGIETDKMAGVRLEPTELKKICTTVFGDAYFYRNLI